MWFGKAVASSTSDSSAGWRPWAIFHVHSNLPVDNGRTERAQAHFWRTRQISGDPGIPRGCVSLFCSLLFVFLMTPEGRLFHGTDMATTGVKRKSTTPTVPGVGKLATEQTTSLCPKCEGARAQQNGTDCLCESFMLQSACREWIVMRPVALCCVCVCVHSTLWKALTFQNPRER